MTRDTRYRLLQRMLKELVTPRRHLLSLQVNPMSPQHSLLLPATVISTRAGLPRPTHHRLQQSLRIRYKQIIQIPRAHSPLTPMISLIMLLRVRHHSLAYE